MPSRRLVSDRSGKKDPQVADQWEIVIVPFPFSTQSGRKRRPALVLSDRTFNRQGSTVLAMITSAGHHPWTGDVLITDLKSAGLHTACLVRLKLFTIDNRLIVKKIGKLAMSDKERIRTQLQAYLPW